MNNDPKYVIREITRNITNARVWIEHRQALEFLDKAQADLAELEKLYGSHSTTEDN